ncbi:hypothetical protein OBBRIDRAFT_102974 [Obba rivulosa]|uniref:NACHT domain-containing protein n=1 Tax=Obba rivulosa TaxID=1052685 RepID=A0A8E2DRY6_9APHY|nr:hypothetical protein OBBRIDRAFT_102974 [Obba rivulosa]
MSLGKRKTPWRQSATFDQPDVNHPSSGLPTVQERGDGERVDAILSSAKGIVGVAADLSSDVPIPGLSRAFSVLESLLSKIEQMRSNKQEARDTINSLKALQDALNSSLNEIHFQTKDMDSTGRQVAQEMVTGSDGLKKRITGLLSELQDTEDIANELRRRHWWSRFAFTQQDADLLKKIHRKVIEATENFKLQGGIAIEGLIRDICDQLRRVSHERRLKANETTLKQLSRSKDASYKSHYVEEKAKLQAGTREQILHEVVDWVKDRDPARRIHVIHGPAGIGKSAISRAVSEALAEEYLGASFFFQRALADCNNAYLVFPTIAYQLAHSRSDLLPHIVEGVRKHLPNGDCQALEHQLRDLLELPLRQITSESPPILFVIDGTDECSNNPDDVVPKMLQLLCQLAQEILPLRILIATRPESYIMGALRSSPHCEIIEYRDLLEVAPEVIDQDIRLFIDAEFKKCATSGTFPLFKERPDAVAELARLADGLFIYASTVVRFLVQDRHYAVDIYDRLLVSQGSLGSPQLYERLDLLYGEILNSAFGRFRADSVRMDHIHQVLTWITLDEYDVVSARNLQLVGIPPSVTMDIVERLRSVLVNSTDSKGFEDIDMDTHAKPCHASFPQFLLNDARCKDAAFRIESHSGHGLIALAILTLFIDGYADTLIGKKDDMISEEDEFPEMWRYVNANLGDQLTKARFTKELCDAFYTFARTRLGSWLRGEFPWRDFRSSGWHKFYDDRLEDMVNVRAWRTRYPMSIFWHFWMNTSSNGVKNWNPC